MKNPKSGDFLLPPYPPRIPSHFQPTILLADIAIAHMSSGGEKLIQLVSWCQNRLLLVRKVRSFLGNKKKIQLWAPKPYSEVFFLGFKTLSQNYLNI